MASAMEKELVKSIRSMFLAENFADVTLVVEGQKIKAHKNIVASRNEVLNAMLTNDMVESKKSVVEIPDVDIETFTVFLKYLYTGIVENDDITLELLILADKYLDQTLKDTCEIYLSQDINFDNAIDKLLVANRHACYNLEMLTATYIADHVNEFIQIPKFDEILACKNVVKSILKESKALLTDSRMKMCTFVFPFNVQSVYSGQQYTTTKITFVVKDVQWSIYVGRFTSDGTDWMSCVLSTTHDKPVKVNLRFTILSNKAEIDRIELNRNNYIFDGTNKSSTFNLALYSTVTQADNKLAYSPGNIMSLEVFLMISDDE